MDGRRYFGLCILVASGLVLSVTGVDMVRTSALGRDYVAPNDVLRRTALLIRTHNRPQCLESMLRSVVEHVPWMNVVVGDDSDAAVARVNQETLRDSRIEQYEYLEDGSREVMVEAATRRGFEFVLIADDGVVLPSRDLILRMAQALLRLRADVVAPVECTLDDGLDVSCGDGMVGSSVLRDSENGVLVLPNVTRRYSDDRSLLSSAQVEHIPPYAHASAYPSSAMPDLDVVARAVATSLECRRTDSMPRFALGRADLLVAEGRDAAISLLEKGARVLVCRRIRILRKNGCAESRGGVGASLSLDLKRGLNPNSMAPNASFQPVRSADERLRLTDAVMRRINDRSLGFYQIMREPSPLWADVPLFSAAINLCLIRVKGVLPLISRVALNFDCEAYRSRCEGRSAGPIPFDLFFLTHATCPVTHQLLRLDAAPSMLQRREGPRPRHLFYVTVVSASQMLDGLVRDLAAQQAGEAYVSETPATTTLVVVVMGTVEKGWEESVRGLLREDGGGGASLLLLVLSPPFGRSIGMRAGFSAVGNAVASRGLAQRDVVVFSVDANLRVPPVMSQEIVRHVHCGIAAYAPICTKCTHCEGNRDQLHVFPDYDATVNIDENTERIPGQGKWVYAGLGMLGVCLSDYIEMTRSARGGGWREGFWYSWGGEDLDTATQFVNHGLLLHRPRMLGLFHIHKNSARGKNPAYYDSRGESRLRSEQDGRTVFPVTVRVRDDALVRKLVSFARMNSEALKYAEFDTRRVLSTSAQPEEDTEFFSLWTEKGELVVVSAPLPEAGNLPRFGLNELLPPATVLSDAMLTEIEISRAKDLETNAFKEAAKLATSGTGNATSEGGDGFTSESAKTEL